MFNKTFSQQLSDVLIEGLGMISFQKEELRNFAYECEISSRSKIIFYFPGRKNPANRKSTIDCLADFAILAEVTKTYSRIINIYCLSEEMQPFAEFILA